MAIEANTPVRSLGWGLFVLALILVYINLATDTIPRKDLYNSDTLFIPALLRDLRSGESLIGWKLQPAPSFFPDMLLYGFLSLFTSNMHLIIMLCGVVQVLLLLFGWIEVHQSLDPSDASQRALPLLAGTLLLLLIATGQCPAFLAILKIGHHFGATLMLVCSLAFILRLLQSDRVQTPGRGGSGYLIFGFFATLALLSDGIYLVQFMVPAGISLLILFGLSLIPGKTLIRLGLTLIVPVLISAGIDRWLLNPWKPAVALTGDIAANVTQASETILDWPEHIWWSHNLLFIFQVVWILFIVISIALSVLLIKRTMHAPAECQRDTGYLWLTLFFIFSILSNIGAALMFGMNDPRYFLPTLLIPLFFGWTVLLTGFQKLMPVPVVKYASYLALLGVFVLFFAEDGIGCIRHISALSDLRDYYPEDVQCLDQEARARNLRYGMAQYWTARYVTMLSHAGLHLAPVVQQPTDKNLVIYHWISNINAYRHDFEFIVAENSPGQEELSLDTDLIIEKFGEPAGQFRCNDQKVLAYNRAQDRTFQTLFQPLFFRRWLARDLPSELGDVVETSRRAAANGEHGFLTYGPYVWLFIGDYRFDIQYTARPAGEMPVGKWDVRLRPAESSGKSKDLIDGTFPPGEQQRLSAVFKIRKEGLIEIRTQYKGHGELIIHALEIEKIR